MTKYRCLSAARDCKGFPSTPGHYCKVDVRKAIRWDFVYIFAAFLDYNSTNQSLVFRSGENCADIEILDDLEAEGTEQFYTYLAIATATGAKVLHSCDYINIYDNEGE